MADVPGRADEDHKPFNLGLQVHDGLELPAFGSSMMPGNPSHELEKCYMNLGELVPTKYTFTAQEMPNPTFYQFLPCPPSEPIHQDGEGENAGSSFVFPDPNSSLVVPVMKIEGVNPVYNLHQQQLDQKQYHEDRKIKNRAAAARSEARRIAYVTELQCQIEAYKEENSELKKKIEDLNMGRMKEPSENPSGNSKIARSNSF